MPAPSPRVIRRSRRSSRSSAGSSRARVDDRVRRRGPRAGDPGPGAGRVRPGRAGDARAVRDRRRRATWSPRCGGSRTGTGATSTGSSTCARRGAGRGPAGRSEEQAAVAAGARPGCREREREHAAGPRGRRAGHPVAGRRAGLDRRAPSPRSSTAPGPGCGWSTCWPLEQAEPPTDRCRPVLLALSSGDRRRQREVDAARHLLECELCARLSRAADGAGPAARRRGARSRSAPTPTSSRRGRPPASWPPRLGFSAHRPDADRDRGVRDRPQHRPVRRRRRDRRRAARASRAAASRWSPATPARASPTSSRR